VGAVHSIKSGNGEAQTERMLSALPPKAGIPICVLTSTVLHSLVLITLALFEATLHARPLDPHPRR
jgi:hypothetical protein